MTTDARKLGALLRARDKKSLRALRAALKASYGAIGVAAQLLGFAGASSIWRVAYATPEVMAILRKHGRRPWERKGNIHAK
jgi:hypothetical protein